MRRLNGVLIEDITDENIVSKPVAERLRAYNENAKLWKVAFIAFLIAFGVNVLLTTFVLDKGLCCVVYEHKFFGICLFLHKREKFQKEKMELPFVQGKISILCWRKGMHGKKLYHGLQYARSKACKSRRQSVCATSQMSKL